MEAGGASSLAGRGKSRSGAPSSFWEWGGERVCPRGGGEERRPGPPRSQQRGRGGGSFPRTGGGHRPPLSQPGDSGLSPGGSLQPRKAGPPGAICPRGREGRGGSRRGTGRQTAQGPTRTAGTGAEESQPEAGGRHKSLQNGLQVPGLLPAGEALEAEQQDRTAGAPRRGFFRGARNHSRPDPIHPFHQQRDRRRRERTGLLQQQSPRVLSPPAGLGARCHHLSPRAGGRPAGRRGPEQHLQVPPSAARAGTAWTRGRRPPSEDHWQARGLAEGPPLGIEHSGGPSKPWGPLLCPHYPWEPGLGPSTYQELGIGVTLPGEEQASQPARRRAGSRGVTDSLGAPLAASLGPQPHSPDRCMTIKGPALGSLCATRLSFHLLKREVGLIESTLCFQTAADFCS